MNYVYARLEWKRTVLGKTRYRFMIYGKNHEPLVRSTEPYSSRRAAVEAINLILGKTEVFQGDGYTDYRADR